MYRDGICHTKDGRFSKSIRYYDINYQLAQAEDKAAIFESWCDFLNYFDSSIHFQLSFLNQHINFQEYQRMIDIPLCGDEFDEIRAEYAQMLKDQLAKGNNGLVKVKYISFSIAAPNYQEAKLRLERIEADIMANFKILGVRAESVSGYDRLKIMHDISPTSGSLQLHRGLDIAVPQGTELLAVHDGIVTTATYDSSFGNYIVIQNSDGYTTKYAHCSALLVSVGQTVSTGDVIAKAGSTGNSTGSHLHIEFLYQGEYLNPYFYLGVGEGSAYGNGFGFTGDVDALDDATFAALIHEAEKYLGMAYVWGGSSPSTGFDCSGFVSYVFTNSGVYNMGRLTAQGIYDKRGPITSESHGRKNP